MAATRCGGKTGNDPHYLDCKKTNSLLRLAVPIQNEVKPGMANDQRQEKPEKPEHPPVPPGPPDDRPKPKPHPEPGKKFG